MLAVGPISSTVLSYYWIFFTLENLRFALIISPIILLCFQNSPYSNIRTYRQSLIFKSSPYFPYSCLSVLLLGDFVSFAY